MRCNEAPIFRLGPRSRPQACFFSGLRWTEERLPDTGGLGTCLFVFSPRPSVFEATLTWDRLQGHFGFTRPAWQECLGSAPTRASTRSGWGRWCPSREFADRWLYPRRDCNDGAILHNLAPTLSIIAEHSAERAPNAQLIVRPELVARSSKTWPKKVHGPKRGPKRRPKRGLKRCLECCPSWRKTFISVVFYGDFEFRVTFWVTFWATFWATFRATFWATRNFGSRLGTLGNQRGSDNKSRVWGKLCCMSSQDLQAKGQESFQRGGHRAELGARDLTF